MTTKIVPETEPNSSEIVQEMKKLSTSLCKTLNEYSNEAHPRFNKKNPETCCSIVSTVQFNTIAMVAAETCYNMLSDGSELKEILAAFEDAVHQNVKEIVEFKIKQRTGK